MKSGKMIAAAGALMLAGTAMAGNTEVFDLGSHVLGGDQQFTADVELADNNAGVLGFMVTWDYSEDIADGSWASDVQVRVTSPTGATYVVGGFDQDIAPDVLWSFDGPGSDGDGHYGANDQFMPWESNPEPKGSWHIEFQNDWAADGNANNYDNVTITFFKEIPAPGALALLGLAGVATRRRRG